MNMKKKLLIVAGGAVGAVAILAQAVWADGKSTSAANVTTQITAEEHAAHHPAVATDATNITVENKKTADEMMQVSDGNMADMMKMMETPEGKAMMDKCLELAKQQPQAVVEG
ncbi:hypothetical protein D3C75_989070 [compost metagenome]